MTIPYARKKAAADLGLVMVHRGYFTPQDAVMIEAARDRANLLIARQAGVSPPVQQRLPVVCPSCNWQSKRAPGKPVTCPSCGAFAAFQWPDDMGAVDAV